DGSGAGWGRLEPQSGRCRVPQRQPAAHGDESERSLPRRLVGDAGAVVLDGADELRTGDLRTHRDLAPAGAHQRAMLYRVFDQRLQEKPRQEQARRAVADLPAEGEMTGVARLQDLRISAQPLDLLV